MGFYALGRQTQAVPSHSGTAAAAAAAARARSLPTLHYKLCVRTRAIRTVNVCRSEIQYSVRGSRK